MRLLAAPPILVVLVAHPALAPAPATQAPPPKPANCNAYKLDEKANRILFNDPRPIILMPPKQERDALRPQGKPGQVFLMKNCDTPDLDADVAIYKEAKNSDPAEMVPSAVRVVILAEQSGWVQVKGHTSLWQGTGWIKLSDELLIVKY